MVKHAESISHFCIVSLVEIKGEPKRIFRINDSQCGLGSVWPNSGRQQSTEISIGTNPTTGIKLATNSNANEVQLCKNILLYILLGKDRKTARTDFIR